MRQPEYLVAMTTHVPDGVDDAEVAEVRTREAANTARLAERGSVLRLWRAPLAPGQWRTLGLFVATDRTELERTLSSMPLRKWRTDEVTSLSPHPNDPGADVVPRDPESAEFLTTFTVRVPPSDQAIDAVIAGEARRASQLADQGNLRRLWRLPEQDRAVGLWQARDTEELTTLLDSLPMTAAGWLAIDTVALTPHPSDPALAPTAAH